MFIFNVHLVRDEHRTVIPVYVTLGTFSALKQALFFKGYRCLVTCMGPGMLSG